MFELYVTFIVLNPREFVLMANELLLMANEFAAMRADKEAMEVVPEPPVAAARDVIDCWF